jgi:hypothetical protein
VVTVLYAQEPLIRAAVLVVLRVFNVHFNDGSHLSWKTPEFIVCYLIVSDMAA